MTYKQGDIVVYIGDKSIEDFDGNWILTKYDTIIVSFEISNTSVACYEPKSQMELGLLKTNIMPFSEYRKQVIKKIIDE